MDIRSYNRDAWNREVEGKANPWTQPATPDIIARAREGDWSVLLTESLPVPREWFPPLEGLEILCLASGGGQQGPILAAAGAKVTVYDNSPAQLAQDRLVAEREGLDLSLIEGDAADLSAFADACFDLVFNPVSTLFMPDVRAVWKEAARVMRPGAALLAGLMNPVAYMFDFPKLDAGILQVAHSIPYSDVKDLSKRELDSIMEQGYPLEFGHSLTNLLGGQLDAGLVLTAMYEDYKTDSPLSNFHPAYLATRAVKPRAPVE